MQTTIGTTRTAIAKAATAINAMFAEVYGQVATQTASFTLTQADNLKDIVVNSATAVVVTLPNNLTVGTEINFVQLGAGAVTFTPASGATRVAVSSAVRTNAQYATATLRVISNPDGVTATYVLSGTVVI